MPARLLDFAHPDDGHVDQRLRVEPIIWLGTVSATGRPHVVPVWFWWADPVVTLFCDPGSIKLAHLRRSAGVSVSLDTAAHGTDVVLGEGSATERDLSAVAEVVERFAAKYSPMLGATPINDWLLRFSQPVSVTLDRLITWRRTAEGSLDYCSRTADGPDPR